MKLLKSETADAKLKHDVTKAADALFKAQAAFNAAQDDTQKLKSADGFASAASAAMTALSEVEKIFAVEPVTFPSEKHPKTNTRLKKLNSEERKWRHRKGVKEQAESEREHREFLHTLSDPAFVPTKDDVKALKLLYRTLLRLLDECRLDLTEVNAIDNVADPSTEEWMAIARRVWVYETDKLNMVELKKVIMELMTGRDQTWRNDPVIAIFAYSSLHDLLYPPGKGHEERLRAERLRKRIKREWQRGIYVKDAHGALVREGEFPSLDALEGFFRRHGK